MRGENGEIIAPSSFITAAERFGLISSIDRWVVRRALALLAGQHIEPGMRLSINLSAVSIGDNELLELIGREIRQRGIEAHRLTFELTETAAMNDLAAAIDFLARLQALGCATALDDFGVGYSSFAYLKDLPVDYVKIDGSFVRDIVSDGVQLAMVKSMNEIARAMGKQTVAEFVENEDVLRMLGEIGVDYAQGYFTGRPRLLDGEQTDA
jgi:EAL domain-containing protein (putative c-di-GMP-specific phosphodiesterase class I)